MFHSRHPSEGAPRQQHFWNRQPNPHESGPRQQHFWSSRPQQHPHDAMAAQQRQHFWNRRPAQRGDYYEENNFPNTTYTGPHSEFRQGPTRWEHTQYADTYNDGYSTSNGRPKMSHREKNMYATPFGTPGFAAENLLADNPWTHDTLGYDYYDYYADQAVRGPFGVAPGSVVPPSQRPYLDGRRSSYNGDVNQAPRRGLGYKLFHKGAPNQPTGGNYPAYNSGPNNGPRGLNKGYLPPGAQFAHTNQPYVGEGYHDVYEDTLPDGGWERYETDFVQTTHQDVVLGGRGLNAAKSQWGNTRNPSMNSTLPMNIPSAASNTTTVTTTTTDGLSVPISDSMEKRETVVSAENPTTGLPLNSATLTKNAK